MNPPQAQKILQQLRNWSRDLGFSDLSVSRANLAEDAQLTQRWLERGFHGNMDYLTRNQALRADPAALHPETLSVISVTMPYWPQAAPAKAILKQAQTAYISRYALGRDYHKTVRGRLRRLARQLESEIGPYGYRAFADSAPIFEKALARDASLGWMGKHTLLIDKQQGSYFFLGELFTDLALPASDKAPVQNGCGSCQACIRSCPTNAISPEGVLDARRCISYLTIELKDSIPEELRRPIGNRIFGCDDCQLVCPWNRDTIPSKDPDFAVRHALDNQPLHQLFSWTEQEFLSRTQGMALRRSGYLGWLRNIAVALGNGPATQQAIRALQSRQSHPSELVREHVAWALNQLASR